MERELIKRCSGGKVVKVKVNSAGGVIERVLVTGDFFAYPEGVIDSLEERLAGTRSDRVADTVREVFGCGAHIIGFNPEELILMIEECSR